MRHRESLEGLSRRVMRVAAVPELKSTENSSATCALRVSTHRSPCSTSSTAQPPHPHAVQASVRERVDAVMRCEGGDSHARTCRQPHEAEADPVLPGRHGHGRVVRQRALLDYVVHSGGEGACGPLRRRRPSENGTRASGGAAIHLGRLNAANP